MKKEKDNKKTKIAKKQNKGVGHRYNPNNIDMLVADNIKRLFADKFPNESNIDVAKRLSISYSMFNYYINGRSRITTGILFEFAKVLGIKDMNIFFKYPKAPKIKQEKFVK